MKEEEKGKTPVVSTYNKDDKHFWAAFLNLARHNVYITVNHINKILGEAEINIDEGVSKCTHPLFYAQSPDFLKPGLCYFLKFLYL